MYVNKFTALELHDILETLAVFFANVLSLHLASAEEISSWIEAQWASVIIAEKNTPYKTTLCAANITSWMLDDNQMRFLVSRGSRKLLTAARQHKVIQKLVVIHEFKVS